MDHWAELLGTGAKTSKQTTSTQPRAEKPLRCSTTLPTPVPKNQKKLKRVRFADDIMDDSMATTNAATRASSETNNLVNTASQDHSMLPALIDRATLEGATSMSLEDARLLAASVIAQREKNSDFSTEPVESLANDDDDDGVKDLEAIERRLASIEYQVPENMKRVPWVETLSVTVNRFVEEDEPIDPADDHRRENSFHDITMLGVKEALRRFNLLSIPFSRPPDFYAEMLKTDNHMHKVKQRLADQELRIKVVESRKKQRLEKKFAKKVQAERIKQKQQEKNKNLKKVEEWKKSKFTSAL